MSEYAVLAIAVGGAGLILCLVSWRIGFLVCLLAGCLQDPIRKIIPGEPIYLTIVIIVYVAATCLGAYVRGSRFSLRPIHSWNNSIRAPLNFFLALVVIQTVVTLIKFGSPILAGIGFLAYVTPVPGILLGYNFARREQDIYKFIKVYLFLNVLMSAGVYLSYLGFNWSTLQSVGEGVIMYSRATGEEIILRSGFFRAPEVAAWHAATSICLLIIMFMVQKKHRLLKLASGALILFFWGALLFTGRRKFIMEIFVFLCVYGGLLLLVRGKATKTARTSFVLMILMGAAVTGYVFVVPQDLKTGVRPYFERGVTLRDDATDRASLMTVESFSYVVGQNGVWGAGAGTGSQGAQYFGGGSEIVGGAAEGGLAKVLAELGLPGIALLIWLGFSLLRYFWAIIKEVKQTDFTKASLIFGLIAMLVGNAFVFATAHQIFGDPFVLSLLGFFIGFILAVPKMLPASAPESVSNRVTLRPKVDWPAGRDVRGEA